MAFTVVLSVLAGLAFRKKLKGGNALFFVTVASLIMPSIIISLGIGLQFRLLDTGIKGVLTAWTPPRCSKATARRSASSPPRWART
jgi:putative spermidine/putrescine transport system permease protein